MRIFVFGDFEEQMLWVRGNSLHCEGSFSPTQCSPVPHQETSAPWGGGASNSSRINVQLWRAPGILCSWPGSPGAWGQGRGSFRNTGEAMWTQDTCVQGRTQDRHLCLGNSWGHQSTILEALRARVPDILHLSGAHV